MITNLQHFNFIAPNVCRYNIGINAVMSSILMHYIIIKSFVN